MKLWALVPELILLGSCLVLVPLAGICRERGRALPAWLALAALLAAAGFTARMLHWGPVEVMDGSYAVDGFAHCFKLLILASAVLSLGALMAYFAHEPHLPHAAAALVFCTLGAVGVASSLDLALIILFLQMLGMATYVLVALVRSDGAALEAGLKLFIYGAVALAVMLYGLTFFYGLAGSLDLREIGRALPAASPWPALALVLVLAGYGFEITLVPFHPWAPDTYAGASAPVSGLLSVLPKIAGIAALLRFLLYAVPSGLVEWSGGLALAAAVTMTFGNLAALAQRRLKRLLAYSSIAQAGYLVMGVAVAERVPAATPAIAYYLAAYLFMNLGAFTVIALLERATGSDSIRALSGLARTQPFAAVVLVLSLLSLAGIPPLAGFAGKVLLLRAVFAANLEWLAALAAVNMVVALYYYARVIAVAVLEPGAGPPAPQGLPHFRLPLLLTAAGSLALGLIPAPALSLLAPSASLLP